MVVRVVCLDDQVLVVSGDGRYYIDVATQIIIQIAVSTKQKFDNIYAPIVAELTPSVILAPGTMPTQVVAETTIPDHRPQLLHAALVEVVMRFKLLPQLLLQMTHAPMVVELILTEILAHGTMMPTQVVAVTTIPDHGLQLPHAA